MKRSELIEKLMQIGSDDTPVFLSADPEGNEFRYLSDVEDSHYSQAAAECLHPDDVKGYPDAIRCICLWPD